MDLRRVLQEEEAAALQGLSDRAGQSEPPKREQHRDERVGRDRSPKQGGQCVRW